MPRTAAIGSVLTRLRNPRALAAFSLAGALLVGGTAIAASLGAFDDRAPTPGVACSDCTTFSVGAAGTLTFSVAEGEVKFVGSQLAEGWSGTAGETGDGDVVVTLTDGEETILVTATKGADGRLGITAVRPGDGSAVEVTTESGADAAPVDPANATAQGDAPGLPVTGEGTPRVVAMPAAPAGGSAAQPSSAAGNSAAGDPHSQGVGRPSATTTQVARPLVVQATPRPVTEPEAPDSQLPPKPSSTPSPKPTAPTTTTPIPSNAELPEDWPPGKPYPPIPPNCREPHLEDDGRWNCD